MSGKIRLLKVKGTPYELGYQHGMRYCEAIQRYAAERIALVETGKWSGAHKPTRQAVLDLAEACVSAHEAYAPDLMQEWRGMADATGLSLAELVVVGGFTDFVDVVYNTYQQKTLLDPALAIDDCTAFIVPDGAANGTGFFGQTWDMHDSATEFVILLHVQPDNAPDALVFTTTGCVGQIGMNEHGIAVGINNLQGADGRVGVTWPFVVRKVLQQDNIEDALACITDAPLAGAHNFMIFGPVRNGLPSRKAVPCEGYNIEAMSTRHTITPLTDSALVHTNHCLIPDNQAVAQERPPERQTSSEARLELAQRLLAERPITIEHLQGLTRVRPICAYATEPYHIETCGAAIMRPKTGDFWAVWGLPAENEYEHFTI